MQWMSCRSLGCLCYGRFTVFVMVAVEKRGAGQCRPSNLIYDKKISTANLKGYISNLDIKEQIPNSTSNLSKDTFTKNPMSRHTGRAVYVNGEPTTSLLLLLQKFTCSGGNGDVV